MKLIYFLRYKKRLAISPGKRLELNITIVNFSISILLIFTNFLLCKKAVFDHPAEGAGGLIIGIKPAQAEKVEQIPNTFIISNSPSSIEEGATANVGIKLSQSISSDLNVKVSSNNPTVTVNGATETILTFTNQNATVDQTITLKVEENDHITPETATINFSATDILSKEISVTANYKFSRKIKLVAPASLAEESTGEISVSLGKKPQGNATVSLSVSDAASMTLSNSSFTFTPENFNTAQKINLTINDVYNDNRSYTVTATSDGETVISNPSITIIDNDFKNIDISANQAINSGFNPSIALDTVNNKIIVAAKNKANSDKPSAYTCDLNGDNCSHADISSGQETGSGNRPDIAINYNANKFLVVTKNNANVGNPSLYTCNLDSTSCAHQTLGTDANTEIYPKINILDSAKFVLKGGGTQISYQFICNMSGTSCSRISQGNLSNTPSYGSRGRLIYNNKIYHAYTGDIPNGSGGYSNFFIPVIRVSNSDGTGIQSFYPTTANNSGVTPDIAIDTVNSKILIATNNLVTGIDGRPWLYRCPLDFSACESIDISGGNISGSYFIKLNIDTKYNRLLAIAYDSSEKLNLYHCNLDGTDCKNKDISFSNSVVAFQSEPNYDAIIDSINNRLLVVYTSGATGKLSLIRFGLGGF